MRRALALFRLDRFPNISALLRAFSPRTTTGGSVTMPVQRSVPSSVALVGLTAALFLALVLVKAVVGLSA
ncbi:MAG: hypothetical protein WKF43_01330 [Acidimicrobiales bacterium]